MGLCFVFFGILLNWDLYEFATLGEVIVRGRLAARIESGNTLLWLHGIMFIFSAVFLWRYYRDYKGYANEVRTHNK